MYLIFTPSQQLNLSFVANGIFSRLFVQKHYFIEFKIVCVLFKDKKFEEKLVLFAPKMVLKVWQVYKSVPRVC